MSVLLGLLIGGVVGLTGVGAGSLTVAALVLLLDQRPAIAVGTALAFTVAIKLAVVPVYIRRGQVHAATLRSLCMGGVPGGLVGVAALEFLEIRRFESAILFTVGLLIATMALYNLYGMVRRPAQVVGTARPSVLPWAAALIGAETGFSSAGAGALGGLLLLGMTTLAPAQVVGTDLTFGLIVSAIGSAWHLADGTFSGSLLAQLVPGGLVGVLLGARLTGILPPRALRTVLSIALLCLGLQLCWKAFR